MAKLFTFPISLKPYFKCIVFVCALLSFYSAKAVVPVVDFTANKTTTFEEDTVQFTDVSTQTPTSWYWEFPGGNPATSTAQNPQIIYAKPGVYDVMHTATNSTGTGTPLTKTGFITITEISKGYNNASAYQLIDPVNRCPGTYDVKVRIKNRGKNIINGLNIDWTIDGVPQNPIFWSNAIDTLKSVAGNDTILTLGSITLATGSAKNLRVWTSYPNFVADTITKDDTLNFRVGASLGGSYTIGGTSPDFTTLSAALASLDTFGLCAPVVFNLRNGTYNGPLTINTYKGISATNTLTIQSENMDASLVTLTHAAVGIADNYTVRLNSSKFVNLKHLTINATGTSYAKAIDLVGNISFDSITQCSVSSINTTNTASATYSAIFGTGITGSNVVISNNVLSGGASGLYFSGISTTSLFGTGLIVESNTFTGSSYYPVYLYNINAPSFKTNKVIVSGTTSTTVYPATFGYCDNYLQITGNQFTVIGSTAAIYGVRVYYCDATTLQRGKVSNNTFSFQTSGTLYGALYSYYSSNIDFFNNSINNYSTGATNYAAYLYHTSTSTGSVFKNNIIANNSTTGYALYVYDPLYITSDYNLLYTKSANMIYKGLATITSYPTLNSYRTAFPALEKNSLVYRPAFTSNTDLTPLLTDTAIWAMNGRGTHTGVSTDINNNARPVLRTDGVPDIGAYQFTPNAAVPLATASPAAAVAGQTQTFLFGGDTLAQITWAAFSGVPTYVDIRMYSDSMVQLTNDFQTRAHWKIQMDPGSYNYSLKLYYKTAMLNNIPSQQNMILSKNAFGLWNHYYNPNTITDSANSTMTLPSVIENELFLTATDNTIPLPVSFINVTAMRSGNSVHVQWNTASEKNTSHFEVERSFDAHNFKMIDQVKAFGNSSVVRKYSLIDEKAFDNYSGNIYYRIRSVDYDGGYQLSTIALVTDDKDKTITVYPNPNNTGIVHFNKPVNVELFDLQGKQLKSATDVTELNIARLAKGIYIIRINGTTSEKLIVE